MGGDGLHPRLLINLSLELSVPLCMLFQTSFESGVLPDYWLSSTIVPIFKKGSRYNPLNYRPISITSVLCKSLERIIVSHIMGYLNDNDILSENQYGFRPGYSTTDQLLQTYNYITSHLDNGRVVDLVFFDFEKAFDRVNHFILIGKLYDLGIDGKFLH